MIYLIEKVQLLLKNSLFLQRKQEQENYKEALWHEQIKNQDIVAKLKEDEEENQNTEIKKKVAKQNEDLSQEQKFQQEYLNKVVYTNAPSENYFSQFNTTSR